MKKEDRGARADAPLMLSGHPLLALRDSARTGGGAGGKARTHPTPSCWRVHVVKLTINLPNGVYVLT